MPFLGRMLVNYGIIGARINERWNDRGAALHEGGDAEWSPLWRFWMS